MDASTSSFDNASGDPTRIARDQMDTKGLAIKRRTRSGDCVWIVTTRAEQPNLALCQIMLIEDRLHRSLDGCGAETECISTACQILGRDRGPARSNRERMPSSSSRQGNGKRTRVIDAK
jgi:hypothetical protein